MPAIIHSSDKWNLYSEYSQTLILKWGLYWGWVCDNVLTDQVYYMDQEWWHEFGAIKPTPDPTQISLTEHGALQWEDIL